MTIAIDKEGNTMMCMHGSHATHADGNGTSGLFITMGKGTMKNASKKPGLATTSSTGTEVVSAGERFLKCA